MIEGLLPISHMTLWSRNLKGSLGKLKPLFLHYHSVKGHQTQQGDDLLWGAPTFKVPWLFNDVYSEITWQNENIIPPLPQCLWPSNLATNIEHLQLLKLQDLSITWSCEVTWHIKYVISALALDQGSLNVARWWLTMRGFHP